MGEWVYWGDRLGQEKTITRQDGLDNHKYKNQRIKANTKAKKKGGKDT